jgi:hypothetical protein
VTEWLVQPVPPLASMRPGKRNVPSQRASCVDGDVRCDFDGVAGKNGSCVFHVAVCANNHDPREATARCVPSAIAEYRVLAPSLRRPRTAIDAANGAALLQAIAGLAPPPVPSIADGRVMFTPPFTTADRCTPFQRLVVPVGTRTFRTRAVIPPKRIDSDQLLLRCLK